MRIGAREEPASRSPLRLSLPAIRFSLAMPKPDTRTRFALPPLPSAILVTILIYHQPLPYPKPSSRSNPNLRIKSRPSSLHQNSMQQISFTSRIRSPVRKPTLNPYDSLLHLFPFETFPLTSSSFFSVPEMSYMSRIPTPGLGDLDLSSVFPPP